MKSFRAAAERIVRQESSTPTDVSRLLGSAADPARTIASEDDEWDIRLAALTAIGGYDALAVFASRPTRLVRSHNISEPRTLQGAVAEALGEMTRRGAAVQLRSPTALADGRVGGEIMLAPLTALNGVEGALLALRAGRGFSATDAVTASSVGTVLALELARAAAALRDRRALSQSLALYELARIGLGHEDLGERLVAMVEVVAKSLGHDVAQLWLLRGGGSLRLRAAHPHESLVLEIARPRDHAGLARALDGEVLQVADPALRSWIRRTTRALIVAPLRGGKGVSGLLALGRFRGEYAADDLGMARQCGDFLGEVVASVALASGGAASRGAAQLEDAIDRMTAS